MMYIETLDALEELDSDDIATMLFAMRDYSQYSVIPDFPKGDVKSVLWKIIKQKLDADAAHYEEIREQRRNAINARWAKENESIQMNTDVYEVLRNIPTTTTTTTTPTPTATPTATPTPTAINNKGYKGKEGIEGLHATRPYTPLPTLDGMDNLLKEVEQRKAEAHDV